MGWIGAILGGVGMINDIDANAKEAQAKQKEIADNKLLAYSAATDAEVRGGKEAGQTRSAASQLIAQQKVAYANSGIDPTVGTAADVMADTRAMSELDAQTLKNNAAREAWGFRRHGLKYGQQAGLEAARASNKQAGTVLGGLGRAAAGVGEEYRRGKWGGE